ncbi:hypothetical protein [uncultured Roseibium sp.]|uniref:hypothetical protein n=1 Tax=uncultured Roseibium sp. TaxID=1936171 RepID=UPI003217257D
MQRRLYQELLWALLGYVIAVLVAAVVAVAPIALKEAISSPGVAAEQGGILPYFFDLYFVGAFIVAMFMTFSAWPGFVIALIVGVRRGYRSLKYFSGCGLAAAFVGALIFRGTPPGGWGASTMWSISSYLIDIFGACLGGAVGGFAYGLFARRYQVFMRRSVSADVFD